MELKITQQQLRRLVEQTSPELSSIEEVRGYTFDWDDNILFMPTKINYYIPVMVRRNKVW